MSPAKNITGHLPCKISKVTWIVILNQLTYCNFNRRRHVHTLPYPYICAKIDADIVSTVSSVSSVSTVSTVVITVINFPAAAPRNN